MFFQQKRTIEKVKDKLDRETEKFNRERMDREIEVSDPASVLITFYWYQKRGCNRLRTVPTIVTAHAFCAFRDTRVSYGWCLLIPGYFCAV